MCKVSIAVKGNMFIGSGVKDVNIFDPAIPPTKHEVTEMLEVRMGMGPEMLHQLNSRTGSHLPEGLAAASPRGRARFYLCAQLFVTWN